jgi:hypothetical protein
LTAAPTAATAQRSERKARYRDRQPRAVAVMNLDVALLLH